MYPNSENPCGSCGAGGPIGAQIVQGGKSSIIVRLINKTSGDPLDLTGVTALSTCFGNADGSELALTLGSGITILSAVIGKIEIDITSAQSTLLTPIVAATLELTITYPSSDPIKIQIPNAYSVIASVC